MTKHTHKIVIPIQKWHKADDGGIPVSIFQ